MVADPPLGDAAGCHIGNNFPFTEVTNKKRIIEIGHRVREIFEFNLRTLSWDTLYIDRVFSILRVLFD
jgi:hypothetical protein